MHRRTGTQTHVCSHTHTHRPIHTQIDTNSNCVLPSERNLLSSTMVPESTPGDPGSSRAAVSCVAEKQEVSAAGIIMQKTLDSKLTLFPK